MTSTHSIHPLSLRSPTSLNNAQRFEYQPLLQSRPRLGKYRTRKVGTPCLSRSGDGDSPKEDIVIVGAGIAGLATALSLHRLGIGSVVLEQADSLRTGGTSLTLFKNGWRVLDAMGVGSDLRRQFLEIQGMTIETEEGRELRSFNFKDADESQEVRAVERKTLLETLADELPPDSVRFSSKLSNISKSKTGEAVLQLADGTEFAPKIVVGCDGVRSSVAKWLGFPEPKYVGYCAFRGLASFPDGQPLEPRVNYIYGRGVRAGYVPVSPTKVYWFVSYNSASPGPKISDPSELMRQARNLVMGWPAKLENIINMTPEETVIRTPLEDRWLWPVITPELGSEECVVLAGDAWHPMTPNLGQGGCCALEDAVVLAKKIAGALRSGDGSISIKEGLRSYGRERWPRVFPLCARAHLVGALLQWENPVVCSLRNDLIVPKLVRVGPLLEHTNFSCEPLTL